MGAFVAAKRRFVVHLRTEDVQRHSPTTPPEAPEAVADALGQLVEWGNLRADPDTSRVTTVEDFHRARFLYQLTQPARPPSGRSPCSTSSSAVAAHCRRSRSRTSPRPPRPRASSARGRSGLGRRAAAARLVRRSRISPRTPRRSWDRCGARSTLRRRHGRVPRLQGQARRLPGALHQGSRHRRRRDRGAARRSRGRGMSVCCVAARRDAEDAAPGRRGAGGLRAEAFAAELAAWEERWRGLRQWFSPSPATRARRSCCAAARGRRSPIYSRCGDAQRASLRPLRSLGRLPRAGAVVRQAPDDAALHRLWRGASGCTARATCARRRHAHRAWRRRSRPSTSWSDAPPLHISPRLRRTGSYERRGRPTGSPTARRPVACSPSSPPRRAEQTAAARARLATGRPTKLGELGELDPDAFGLFLALLGDALAARRPGQREVAPRPSTALSVSACRARGAAHRGDPYRCRHLPRARPRDRDHRPHRVRAEARGMSQALERARGRQRARAGTGGARAAAPSRCCARRRA